MIQTWGRWVRSANATSVQLPLTHSSLFDFVISVVTSLPMANRHWLISIFHGIIQLKLIQRMRFKAEVTTDLFVAQRCVLKTGSRRSATHLFYPKKMLRCLAWGKPCLKCAELSKTNPNGHNITETRCSNNKRNPRPCGLH